MRCRHGYYIGIIIRVLLCIPAEHSREIRRIDRLL